MNGRLQGEQEGAPFRPSTRAFYVGAEPDSHNRAAGYMTGALDEVRLSSVVRYAEEFRPAFSHMADRHTVLLLHFDTDTDKAFFDASPYQHVGTGVGAPRILEERR